MLYGDPNFAREQPVSAHEAIYYVFFTFGSDAPPEPIGVLCEALAITMSKSCIGDAYTIIARARNVKPHPLIRGSNIQSGLYASTNNGVGLNPVAPSVP